MKKLGTLLLSLAVMSSIAEAQYKGKYVGWSTGYVYGGGTLAPGVYKAFTHLINFHITVGTNGSLGTGDLPQSNQSAFVSACHANGVKAILDIGGQGEHAHFVAATATPALQTTLVKNIMAMTLQYGYDGVDLDWEVAEDPNYDNSPANVAHFKAFHQEVVDSVKKHQPLMVTAAITDDWYPNCSAAVCPMMDQANGMSYDISAANEYKDADIVFKLGAPKANHGIGFDMKNMADNLAKCRLAIDSSFGGVMGWDVTKSNAAAYDSIAHYVNHSTTKIAGPYFSQPKNDVRLFIKNDQLSGLTLISYSVPSSTNGTVVDLGMYNFKGTLVKTIFHGSNNSGQFPLPVNNKVAGRYIVKLSTNSNTQATSSVVIK